MKSTVGLSSAAFALMVLAAASAPSAFADSIDLHVNTGNVSVGIDIGTPPPAPIVETVPVARPGYVWTPGFWSWEGRRHVWVRGAWQKERPGYAFVPGKWEQRGNSWHFEPGRWEQRAAAEGRVVERRVEERRAEEHHAEARHNEERREREYSPEREREERRREPER
jgi:WXXGXW repeat (2 copies)